LEKVKSQLEINQAGFNRIALYENLSIGKIKTGL
jgi:hypothetical protein